MPSASRVTALDGLRGIAALVVVVHHCLLVSPSLAAAYYGGDVEQTPLRIALVYTPLHLLWGGAEAVVVFFVLSGFVLARAIRSRSFDWFGYFPSRMVRLYLPVVAAVAFAFAIILLPHDGAPASPWLDRDPGYPFAHILKDLTLVGGSSGTVSPLWTLRWEVLFSLLLPVVAYALRLIPGWVLGIACVGMSVLGAVNGVSALQYLPIFGVGVALEGEWDRVSALLGRMTRRRGWLVWSLLVLLAVTSLSMHWLLLAPLGHAAAAGLAQAPIVSGAALLVVLAVNCPALRRALTWRPVALLGAISFSLYLIHEPIVILMANVTNTMIGTVLTAVPLALVTAWLFWHAAERPAHRLARTVRRHAAHHGIPGPAAHPDPAAEPAPVEHDGTPVALEHARQ